MVDLRRYLLVPIQTDLADAPIQTFFYYYYYYYYFLENQLFIFYHFFLRFHVGLVFLY